MPIWTSWGLYNMVIVVWVCRAGFEDRQIDRWTDRQIDR